MAAVVISMLCLLAVLLLPCMVTGRKNPQSFFRLWCGYLAFVPTVSVSSLIHLLEGKEQIRMSQALLQGHILTAVREGLVQMVPVLVTLVPLLLLFGAVYKDRSDGFSVSRKWGIMLLILTALGVIAVLFPILAPYASYWFCYLLLLETFVLWEKVIEQYPRLNGWGYILFGGCFLRGIYICMEVMSKFHI